MPEKGKISKWEREDNRTKIFRILLEKSLTFEELVLNTGFARATINKHLQDLKKEKVIEKAIENDKVVYRSILDEERIISEYKKMNFDLVLKGLSSVVPEVCRFLDLFIQLQAKMVILQGKWRIEKGQELTPEEFIKREPKLIREISELHQKINKSSKETEAFMQKYYDKDKKELKEEFWETMLSVSKKELEKESK